MFNLIVKGDAWAANGRDTILASRVFESTEQELVLKFKPGGQLDVPLLSALPTLFLQEGQGAEIARVGSITRARIVGREISLDYTFDLGVPSLLNSYLHAIAAELDTTDFEFMHTHWAVKDVDLYRVLVRNAQPRRQRPTVFQLAEHENIEPSLMSAMIPFHPSFDAVYGTLHRIADAIGLRCRRADDIWENPAVIQDVVSLIDRSKIVICDCTGRNPNVFYEIGIAHTLGREVILINPSGCRHPF
jgi:hypothetical protein